MLKQAIKSLASTSMGRPTILNKILLMNTSEYYIHKWVSKNLSKNDIVLDVGARTFRYTKYQKVKALFGVDIPSETQGYLGWTEQSLKQLNPSIFPVLGSCEILPFADNSFDKIIMTEVIEHIEHDSMAVQELARVLKNNGILLLTTPNGDIVENSNPYHYRHYRTEQIFHLLKKYFDDVIIESHFHNKKLIVKQHLPKNRYFLKKAFYRYLYWVYYLFTKNRYTNSGTKIFATCTKNCNNKIFPNQYSYLDIVACPLCKKRLINLSTTDNCLYCDNCKKSYNYYYNIPNLYVKTSLLEDKEK